MLDKLTRQRLDTFVAAAYGKEAEVCKLEKETVKIMEKAERNICNIESYVDFYVNYLVSRVIMPAVLNYNIIKDKMR